MKPTLEFTRAVTAAASKRGIKLDLQRTADGWTWRWSNGVAGHTSAETRAVALVFACEDIAPWLELMENL